MFKYFFYQNSISQKSNETQSDTVKNEFEYIIIFLPELIKVINKSF